MAGKGWDQGRRASAVRVWVVAVALLAPSLMLLTARADSTTTMRAILPSAREGTSAVWDGAEAYIFGGYHYESAGYRRVLSEIVRYDSATDSITTMSATLPGERSWTSAVWTGDSIYIFGGEGGTELNEIVRYNPNTNVATTMPATLPTGRSGTSAVWDGTNAYIFGGYDGSYLGQIVRYNPATGTVTTMHATLPSGLFGTSAVWDGTNAYIFGGDDGSSVRSDILQYNPIADKVTKMVTVLPNPRYAMAAAWDGSNAYVFGGDGGDSSAILRFTPPFVITEMNATLPVETTGPSAVWDGSHAYIFGGHEYFGNDADASAIVKYTPSVIPSRAFAETVPPLSTPVVAPRSLQTPEIDTLSCTLGSCTHPTIVPGQHQSTPDVPSQAVGTPSAMLPYTCTLLLCVGPFTIPRQTIATTPHLTSQDVSTPDETLPPVCAVGSELCLPPTPLLRPQTVTTPLLPGVPLTDAITVFVSTNGFYALISPHAGEVGTIGPLSADVPTPFGPFPVTLCPSGCPGPAAQAAISGSITVTLSLGTTTISKTVNVSYPE